MIYSPVVIATLNRLDHLKVCLESLSRCTGADMTEVYIGLDYPPSPKYVEGYKQVKAFLESCGDFGFKKLHVIKRDENYCPAKNFRELQVYVFTKHDRLIYCDDDVEFSPNALDYFNKCFEKYKDDKDVVAVTAFSYPIQWKVSEGATCLKQNVNAAAWGTGFWKDSYEEMFSYMMNNCHKNNLRKVIKERIYLKMIEARKQNYFTYACSPRIKRKDKDYWRLGADFAMLSYIAIENKYFISPVLSKTKNHGFDGSGATCGDVITEFGNTALTYDYEHQPIDTATTFELVEDTLHDDEANRIILDKFDCRDSEELKYTYRLIWLCEHLGCWAGKLYAWMSFPFKIMIRILK